MLKDRTDLMDAAVPPAAKAVPARRLVFISHATPQDNTFAEWLATQLAIAGYEVWCDVTQLLGGEKFWNDITEAIDAYAFRFLFVSTLPGNTKPGTLRELRLAQEARTKHGLKGFIVPLKIDQFPFASMQVSIQDLNMVRFDTTWAAGLAQLLKLLEREGAPRSEAANAACVTDWYRRSLDRTRQIVVSNDKYLSNWFRLKLPKRLRFHRYSGTAEQLSALAASFTRPHRVHGGYLATFAPGHEVETELGPAWDHAQTVEPDTQDFINNGDERLEIESRDAAAMVSDLVRQAWESEMRQQGLCFYELASGLLAWFFRNGDLEKNRAYFKALGGRRAYRQLVGLKSKKTADGTRRPDGYWHYAISASPQLVPFPRLVLRHHVLFTDDGEKPWANAGRMHKARRSVCKQWWNREWRDRLLAMCARLGRGAVDLRIRVGDGETMRLAMVPMSFVSPWTYCEDGEAGLDETTEIELVEDQDDEDEESDAREEGDDGETI
jgi:hypothetical protein